MCKRLPAFLAQILVAISIPLAAWGDPQNGQVTRGLADITSDANTTTIDQMTDRAIIEWDSFDTSASESVIFNQPTTEAITLNRILGSAPTVFSGTLNANGNVFLINQNGILFSAGSAINVGGLLATTLDMDDESFIRADTSFDFPAGFNGNSGNNAMIINRGNITAREGGLLALVAPGVENSGLLSARLGKVVLASGTAFTIDFTGDDFLSIAIDGQVGAVPEDNNGDQAGTLVDQTGTIQADGGRVLVTAKAARNILDNVINMDGIVQARTVSDQTGDNSIIVLGGGDDGVNTGDFTQNGGDPGTVSVSGTLDASAMQEGAGGDITIIGEFVEILDTASIRAEGLGAPGGEIIIGGDERATVPFDNPHTDSTVVQMANGEKVAIGTFVAADADVMAGIGGFVSIFGYIVYLEGDLPIILTASHGGNLSPASVSDRLYASIDPPDSIPPEEIRGKHRKDAFTIELTQAISQGLQDQTGSDPHVILVNLARIKLDANRDINSPPDGDGFETQEAVGVRGGVAERAYDKFIEFMLRARQDVVQVANGQGLHLDIHGQSVTDDIQFGMLLNENDFIDPSDPDRDLTDEELNARNDLIDKSSIRNLTNNNASGATFAELVRGETSLAGLLEAKEPVLYKSRPSPSIPSPARAPDRDGNIPPREFFQGGFNVKVNGSQLKEGSQTGFNLDNIFSIDSINIEAHRDIRFDSDNRAQFGADFADVLVQFFALHYGRDLAALDSGDGNTDGGNQDTGDGDTGGDDTSNGDPEDTMMEGGNNNPQTDPLALRESTRNAQPISVKAMPEFYFDLHDLLEGWVNRSWPHLQGEQGVIFVCASRSGGGGNRSDVCQKARTPASSR